MANPDSTQAGKTTVTILLVGDAGCGKSTFLSRLKAGPVRPLNSSNNPNVANTASQIDLLCDSNQPFIYDVRFSRKSVTLEIYDTANTNQHWSTLRPDMVILAFDISNRKTLDGLRGWRNDTTRYFQHGYGERIPIFMLGLKRDLRVVNENIIYPQETYRIAQELFCDRYAECSAVTGELLAETFEDISRMAALTTTDKGAQSSEGCVIC